ncbi:hypothetical protein QFZ75_005362 [Streptomyces sp. V3I8]|nr:hypothetical protein [Streptomyces sp. V3I8]
MRHPRRAGSVHFAGDPAIVCSEDYGTGHPTADPDAVEGRSLRTTFAVRDSKNPAGPVRTLDPAAFTTFLDWTATTARQSRSSSCATAYPGTEGQRTVSTTDSSSATQEWPTPSPQTT